MLTPRSAIFVICCCVLVPRAFCQRLIHGRGDFQFDVDVARFYLDEKRVYTELYYSMQENMLAYRVDTPRCVGGMNMKLEVRHDSVLVVKREWSVPHVLLDTAGFSSGQKLVGLESFGLAPGSYRFTVSGYDLLDTTRRSTVAFPFRVAKYPSDSIVSSDVELCSSIQPSRNKESMFYKNTYEVIPNAGRLYGINLPFLYYYVEAYNLLKDSFHPYIVVRTTVANAAGTEVIRHDKTKPRTLNSSVEAGTVNIAALRSGTYEFHVAFMDSTEHVYASASKKFFLYKPGAVRDTASPSPSGDVLASEYPIMTGGEIDREFAKAQYVATDADRAQYKKLSDAASKRRFIYDFWHRREMQQPGCKQEYLSRAEYAFKKFTVGTKEGWKSDRGRVAILYGLPDDVERFESTSQSIPYEIWHLSNLQGGVIFVFVDRTGFGDYVQVHSTCRTEFQDEAWFQHFAQKMQ